MVESPEERTRIEELYGKFKRLMFKCAMEILHNESESMDAVHDAFLYIIKNKEKYLCLSDTNFRSYGVVLVESRALDIQRSKKPDLPIEDFTEVLPSDDNIEIELENRKQLEILRQTVRSLDENSRLVFEMKYELGMSYSEIKEKTGFDNTKIDNILRNAKRKLRILLGEFCNGNQNV
jgi:RNA polymerase sigma-70 factor (ECF subfamily)